MADLDEGAVERVARALYEAMEGPVANQDFARQCRQWDRALALARVAYEAARPVSAGEADASPAPAAMPSDEELSTLLRCYGEFGTTEARERAQSRECASAILSLFQERFASILEEKEREIPWLKADRDNSNSLLDACRHERNVLQKICAERADALDAAEARALAAESALAAAREEGARAAVQQIASVAVAVGSQAAVGASETAGLIVSVLAANPELTERFMAEGSELFIDGTMRPENGCLSHMAMNGQVVSPTKLRTLKGQSQ